MSGGRFDAMKELTNIRDQVNRVLGETFSSGTYNIPLDVYETEDTLVIVTAPLVGANQETLEIAITDGALTVECETVPPQVEEGVKYLKQERKFGLYTRSYTLPIAVNADEAKAEFSKNEILTITLPRVQPSGPRVVKVKTV